MALVLTKKLTLLCHILVRIASNHTIGAKILKASHNFFDNKEARAAVQISIYGSIPMLLDLGGSSPDFSIHRSSVS
jgi:hypothetical protein